MAKKPEPPKPIIWNVYVEATDEAAVMEKAAAEFKVTAHETDGGQAMTRRKGEITRGDLKRKWPHHLALLA